MTFHSEYFGCSVYRQRTKQLNWMSPVNGQFLYADTLAGIKGMIREREPFGHCDTCGALCNVQGCIAHPSHAIALGY